MRVFLIGFIILLLPISAAAADSISALNIFNAANAARQAAGLSSLKNDASLEQAAQARAIDIIQSGLFSHTGPNSEPFYIWLQDAHLSFVTAGENLAKDFEEPRSVVSAWLKSPSHRANLLDQNYTLSGVGTATGAINGEKTTVVVQFFSQPKILSFAAQEPSISLPPAVRGEVLGARTPENKNALVWSLLGLFLNAAIAMWFLDHCRFHRRTDQIFK